LIVAATFIAQAEAIEHEQRHNAEVAAAYAHRWGLMAAADLETDNTAGSSPGSAARSVIERAARMTSAANSTVDD
jgi:hypothetical protein